jgi:hypothetical protein
VQTVVESRPSLFKGFNFSAREIWEFEFISEKKASSGFRMDVLPPSSGCVDNFPGE